MAQTDDWKNHETRTVFLHLVNDFELYELTEKFKAESSNWVELSDKLNSYFKEMTAIALESPTTEVVELLLEIGSLGDVDFDQIAQELFRS